MKSKFNFTMNALKALPVPSSGRAVYQDEQVKYLRLMILPSGRMTYYYVRNIDGQMKWVKLGIFPETTVVAARNKAAEKSVRIAKTGSLDGRIEKLTIKALWKLYKAEYGEKRLNKASFKNTEYIYKKHYKSIENLNLNTLTTPQLNKWHGSIEQKISANRALALVRSMINWAITNGYFEGINPAANVKMHPEKSRDRFLDKTELIKFFREVEKSSHRDFFLLLLFTGARRGNVQAMRWRDIDLERGTWTTLVKKSVNPVKIILTTEAVALLMALKKKANNDWVFPANSKTGHIVNPRKAWKKLCDAAELEDLHIHDLRRTLGSWQAAMGASLPIIGKSLGHQSTESTAIYARLNLDPIRQSVQSAVSEMLQCMHPDQKDDNEPCDVDQTPDAQLELPYSGEPNSQESDS